MRVHFGGIPSFKWLADLNCKSVCELLHSFTVLISEPQRSSLDVACANTGGDGRHILHFLAYLMQNKTIAEPLHFLASLY